MEKQKTDELSVLLPEREVVINGETITVREYSLYEMMQLYPLIDGFVTPLSELLGQRESLIYQEVEQLIAQHYEIVVTLMAQAINKPRDYVAKLSGKNGLILMDIWWTVNSAFFINAAMRKLVQQAAIK